MKKEKLKNKKSSNVLLILLASFSLFFCFFLLVPAFHNMIISLVELSDTYRGLLGIFCAFISFVGFWLSFSQIKDNDVINDIVEKEKVKEGNK